MRSCLASWKINKTAFKSKSNLTWLYINPCYWICNMVWTFGFIPLFAERMKKGLAIENGSRFCGVNSNQRRSKYTQRERTNTCELRKYTGEKRKDKWVTACCLEERNICKLRKYTRKRKDESVTVCFSEKRNINELGTEKGKQKRINRLLSAL